MSKIGKILWAVFGIVLFFGVIVANMKPSSSPPVPDVQGVEVAGTQPSGPARHDQPVRIEGIAVDPYARDQYPATFAKFGGAVVAVNSDRKEAADIAATYADCDYVQNAQITTASPMVNRRYWVECGNLTRLYFDEDSLRKGEPVELQTKANWIANGLKDW